MKAGDAYDCVIIFFTLQLNIANRKDISMKEIHHIYDKAFKRILTLSDKAVINLINGLFGTDYPTNSKITYNWTEHEDKELKRTLSDSILTINDRDIYHMEAQMTEDEEIVFRVFEYGFGHAYKNRTIISGGEQMILLLKLRKKMEKIRSKENMEELQNLVMNDIIGAIHKNEELGNLSRSDALDLIDLTTKLYMKIYSKYQEMEDFTMRMVDQSLELASDKYEKTVEELQEEIVELKDIIHDLQQQIKTLHENNS